MSGNLNFRVHMNKCEEPVDVQGNWTMEAAAGKTLNKKIDIFLT